MPHAHADNTQQRTPLVLDVRRELDAQPRSLIARRQVNAMPRTVATMVTDEDRVSRSETLHFAPDRLYDTHVLVAEAEGIPHSPGVVHQDVPLGAVRHAGVASAREQLRRAGRRRRPQVTEPHGTAGLELEADIPHRSQPPTQRRFSPLRLPLRAPYRPAMPRNSRGYQAISTACPVAMDSNTASMTRICAMLFSGGIRCGWPVPRQSHR